MILVDWQILDRITRRFITVEPFELSLVQPNSLDIRLGIIASGTRECTGNSIVLAPGQFMLAETLEVIGLPDNIVASIEGKSSIARLGGELHQTGGWIDAGLLGLCSPYPCSLPMTASSMGMPGATTNSAPIP